MGILTTISNYKKSRRFIGNNPDLALVNVAYTDSHLAYMGRWVDTGTGKFSGWGGSCIRFKVIGTGTLNIKTSVVDNSGTDATNWVVYIDGVPNGTTYSITSATESFTGIKYIPIEITNNNVIHTVELQPNGTGSALFGLTSQIIVQAYTTGSLAVISNWTQGSTLIQCIGDSWMSGLSWTRLLDPATYNVYQISNGGYTCAQMDTDYNYDYTGVLNTSDPTAQKAIIAFGVNDFNTGVTVPNFQVSLLSLIDKVRVRQPNIPIRLVRIPKNLTTGDDFGQYGTAMSNAAGLRAGVNYIDTTSLDPLITWTSDTFHLDAQSRILFKNFVQPLL